MGSVVYDNANVDLPLFVELIQGKVDVCQITDAERKAFPHCEGKVQVRHDNTVNLTLSFPYATKVAPFTLRGALKTIVCYSYTFENNLEIK